MNDTEEHPFWTGVRSRQILKALERAFNYGFNEGCKEETTVSGGRHLHDQVVKDWLAKEAEALND